MVQESRSPGGIETTNCPTANYPLSQKFRGHNLEGTLNRVKFKVFFRRSLKVSHEGCRPIWSSQWVIWDRFGTPRPGTVAAAAVAPTGAMRSRQPWPGWHRRSLRPWLEWHRPRWCSPWHQRWQPYHKWHQRWQQCPKWIRCCLWCCSMKGWEEQLSVKHEFCLW